MKKTFIRRPGVPGYCNRERGVTMVLVALAMVSIIAMAALSIDVITLYLAREEAQRSADAAALAAARVISISGITGTADPAHDPSSWRKICGDMTSEASLTAQAVAQQNAVAGSAPSVSVKYSVSGSAVGNTDCSGLSTAFAINPTVIVQVTRDSLPTLFSRIWSRNTNTVSATAVAEAFNPSNSFTVTVGDPPPVVPRCVKPWIIPNKDPATPANRFVDANGAIQGSFAIGTGIIGESFVLQSDCNTGAPNCTPPNMKGPLPPAAGFYIPALVTQSAIAFPTCADDSLYQKAIGGCDANTPSHPGTVYACGTTGGAQADLTINPSGGSGDTSTAAQCLIRQSGGVGQDSLDTTTYPYLINAGSSNPIVASGAITASNSIVTIPIYDDTATLSGTQPPITILGFLQIFIDSVDTGTGNLNVHVLNIAGCGNDVSPLLSAPGTSPVPIRLITSQ